MVRKVRDDFVGVIYLPNGVMLGAGDDIPDGAVVGAHVTGEDESQRETVLVGEPGPELVDFQTGDEGQVSPEGDLAPRGNASLEAWQEYAKSKGATDEDLDGMTRDEIRDLYAN